MRPPSYYTSSSYTGNHSSGSTSYSTLPNSSKQLRSSFSSPTSATYASRTHLPFVAQSALVAHCITGGGSSSHKPYPSYTSSPSTSTRSNYISSSSSSFGSLRSSASYQPSALSSNKYLTSTRPLSTKRTAPTATTRASSYLSSSSSGHLASSSPSSSSSYTALSRPSYLSSQPTSSRSSYRPNSSSYYKPIRLRERPLLNQLQARLTVPSQSTTRSPTPTAAALDARESAEPTAANDLDDEKTWSSDVTRNISRNKYLIKFKEFDSKAQRQSLATIEPDEIVNLREPKREEELDVEQENRRPEIAVPEETTELTETTTTTTTSEAMKDDCENIQVESNDGQQQQQQQVDCDKTEIATDLEGKQEEPKKVKSKAPAVKKRNVKLKLKQIKASGEQEQREESARVEQLVTDENNANSGQPATKEAPSVATTTTEEAKVEQQQVAPKAVRVKRPLKVKSKLDEQQQQNEQQPRPAAKTNTKPRKVLLQKQSSEETKQKSSQLPVVEEKQPNQIKAEKSKPKKTDELQSQQQIESTSQVNKTTRSPPTSSKRIRFREYKFDDFNFLTVLGHGGWGFVVLAELKEHDACFAVKCIKKITIVEDDDFDSILIERKVLALGNVHPFICKLFCTFETEGYLFFVMEYCAGGDLMFHVQREGKFTESRCRFYAAEIICAIRFLHNRHIIYRDLKLDNILLDSSGHIRLVDFGMCQCRSYREEMLPSNFCGTPEYISPEIIKGVPYNHSVDWWSFGVLLYEMAVGKMPFRGDDENELLWNVCYEQIHYPMFLSKELTSLLQLLLEREPTKRMGMATCKAGDIKDQPYFHSVDWRAIEELRVKPPFVPEVNSKCDVQNFDSDFTESACELSPVDESTLNKIDQNQFHKFPYTNPNIEIFDSQL